MPRERNLALARRRRSFAAWTALSLSLSPSLSASDYLTRLYNDAQLLSKQTKTLRRRTRTRTGTMTSTAFYNFNHAQPPPTPAQQPTSPINESPVLFITKLVKHPTCKQTSLPPHRTAPCPTLNLTRPTPTPPPTPNSQTDLPHFDAQPVSPFTLPTLHSTPY